MSLQAVLRALVDLAPAGGERIVEARPAGETPRRIPADGLVLVPAAVLYLARGRPCRLQRDPSFAQRHRCRDRWVLRV